MLNFDVDKFVSLDSKERQSEYEILKNHISEEALKEYFVQDNFSSSIYLSELKNDKITNNEFNMLYELFNKNKFHNSEDLAVLKKLVATLAFINNALKPISAVLDIDYEIGLVGGALRDFLLGKKELIKDLDIVFSIKNIKGFSHPKLIKQNERWLAQNKETIENLDGFLTQEELKNLLENSPFIFNMNGVWDKLDFITKELNIPTFIYNEEKGTSDIEQLFFHIVKELLGKQFNIEKAYEPRVLPSQLSQSISNPSEIWRSGYHNALLRGVVKLSSPNFIYPVDVLLCNRPIKEYLNTFDFEICKAWLVYNEKNSEELDSFLNFFTLDKLEQSYEKIAVSRGFIKDQLNKTLTLSPMGFDLNAVEEALLKHYPRVKEKFKNYTFNANQKVWDGMVSEEIKNYIISFMNYEQINNVVPNKEESKEIKKQAREKL